MTIDIGSLEIRALASSVVDDRRLQPFGAYVFSSDEPAAELARVVERAVLLEAFGDTPDVLSREYGPYEQSSFFLCILDHRRMVPAGAVRLIVPTEEGPGLKTLNDIGRDWERPAEELLSRSGVALPPEATWDIATLAVSPEYRSAFATGLVAMGLYQTGIRVAVELGVDWMVAILDTAVFRMSKARFHEPFFAFADDRPYLGSKLSVPIYFQIPDYRRRLAISDPTMHGVLYEGVGIEAALAPAPLEISLAVARRVYKVPAVRATELPLAVSGRFRAAAAGRPAPGRTPPAHTAATG